MNNKAIKLRQELLGGVKTNIIQFEGSNPDNRIKNSRFIFQKQESGGGINIDYFNGVAAQSLLYCSQCRIKVE